MMETFAIYLLKSVTWLAGFGLVFFLFLSNERFFRLNRLYLISGLLVSFFFPLITVHYSVDLASVASAGVGEATVTGSGESGTGSFPDAKTLISALYLSGVLFFAYMIIKQSRSIIKTIRKAEIIDSHPVKLIRSADYAPAFSFFSYVFVNPSTSDIETKEILNHEMVHIRQKHWVDLVLAELLCILQWFNPMIWIYIRFIRQNHEYLADEVALQRTSDPAIYRAALLNQIVGAPVVSLVNSFNYSLNKKRFKMMKNISSSPYRKMKVLFILPLVAIVFFAFAKPEYKIAPGAMNAVYPPGLKAGMQEKTVKGKVTQPNGQTLPGAMVFVRGTTLGTATDDRGGFNLTGVPEDATLVVTFVGFKSKVIKPDFASAMNIKMVRDTINYIGRKRVSPPPPTPPPPPVNGTGNTESKPTEGSQGSKAAKKTEKEVFVVVEELPQFTGGKDLPEWLLANVKYPPEAVKKGITGVVLVDFLVSKDGKIKDIKVIKPVNPLLDAEAKRVIGSMPDWKPGKQGGKAVNVNMRVPVKFALH
jgi:TonB family protein